MGTKDFAELDTGFPIYGLRFINNHTILACGGGGEGNNGIPNKVTAIRCSFTVSDKNRRLQRFREITLPSNEDSPMCVEFCSSTSDDNIRYLIFVGCNQSTELMRSMNINNNLRKYNYTFDEHLQFRDAVQFDDSLLVESIGEYPKIVHISSDSSVGGMMTSRIPSEIFIFNPDTLELKLRFKPSSPSEIKDFHLSPKDSGQTLTYLTASLIETISTNSGSSISSSSNVDKKTAKTLGKYFFSKLRYVDGTKIIITAALRNGKGAAVLEYNTETGKVTKEKVISSKIKGIVAIDVSNASGLFAVAGNDFSVSLLRLSDFKTVKTYTKLHKFAVTCLSFSPDGKKLATGSASNTLSVLKVKSSSGGFFSFIYSIFRFFFFAIMIGIFAFFVQRVHQNGELNQYIDLSKEYGSRALVQAQHFQKVGFELSQKYGKEYYELSQHYGKIGFEIARDQTFRGVDMVKDQISKRKASYRENNVISHSFSTSTSLPDWADEHNERTSTIQSDIVREVTKDVHELTDVPGEVDTLSIINAATQLSMMGSAAPSNHVSSPEISAEQSTESEEIVEDAQKFTEISEDTRSFPSDGASRDLSGMMTEQIIQNKNEESRSAHEPKTQANTEAHFSEYSNNSPPPAEDSAPEGNMNLNHEEPSARLKVSQDDSKDAPEIIQTFSSVTLLLANVISNSLSSPIENASSVTDDILGLLTDPSVSSTDPDTLEKLQLDRSSFPDTLEKVESIVHDIKNGVVGAVEHAEKVVDIKIVSSTSEPSSMTEVKSTQVPDGEPLGLLEDHSKSENKENLGIGVPDSVLVASPEVDDVLLSESQHADPQGSEFPSQDSEYALASEGSQIGTSDSSMIYPESGVPPTADVQRSEQAHANHDEL